MKRSASRWLLVGGAAAGLSAVGWYALGPAPSPPALQLPASPPAADQPTPRFSDLLAAAENRARDPRTAREGLAELGRLYHANGFLAEAEFCWQRLQELEPAEARWVYLQADVRHTAGDPEAFEALLRRTVELAPDYATAWLKLADLTFKTGRSDEARQHYQTRLQLLPGDPYARLGQARILRQQGQTEEAAQVIADLVRDHPDFPPAHNLYAEQLAAQGDQAGARRHRWLGRESGRFREAEDPWLNELTAWCYDPQRLAVLGTAEFQLSRGDRGRTLIERAVRIAPQDASTQELLGDLYLKLAEPALARESLQTALRLYLERGGDPPVQLYTRLVEAWNALGQPQEALRMIEQGLAQIGERHELLRSRGVILEGLGRRAEAEAALRAAVAIEPLDPDANFDLAIVLLQADRRAEATRYLQAALVRQPTFPKALSLLAQLALDAGQIDDAGNYVRPLYDANPGEPAVQALTAYWHLESGLAAAQNGEVDTAERHFREGLEAENDNVDLLISLGNLLVTQQRAVEAETPLQTYRRLRPQEAQGALLLAEAWLQRGRGAEARDLLVEAERLATRAGQTRLANRSRELLAR